MTPSGDASDVSDPAQPVVATASNSGGTAKPLQDMPPNFLADYDSLTILAVHSFNFPEDALRDKYQEAQENVHLWQAWEAATTEEHLTSKTKSHDLPSDSSAKSILARSDYRAKVIKYWRGHGNWLSSTSTQTGTKTLKVVRSKANAAVVQVLSAVLPPIFADVEVILKPILRSLFFQQAGPAPPHLFTFVAHSYDTVAKAVSTTIRELTFDINIGPPDKSDTVQVEMAYALAGRSFIHELWNKQKESVKAPMFSAGEGIMQKFTVHLAAIPALNAAS